MSNIASLESYPSDSVPPAGVGARAGGAVGVGSNGATATVGVRSEGPSPEPAEGPDTIGVGTPAEVSEAGSSPQAAATARRQRTARTYVMGRLIG